MVMAHRFDNELDECIHIMLAVLMEDVYTRQKLDMLDSYGADMLNKAYLAISSGYVTM